MQDYLIIKRKKLSKFIYAYQNLNLEFGLVHPHEIINKKDEHYFIQIGEFSISFYDCEWRLRKNNLVLVDSESIDTYEDYCAKLDTDLFIVGIYRTSLLYTIVFTNEILLDVFFTDGENDRFIFSDENYNEIVNFELFNENFSIEKKQIQSRGSIVKNLTKNKIKSFYLQKIHDFDNKIELLFVKDVDESKEFGSNQINKFSIVFTDCSWRLRCNEKYITSKFSLEDGMNYVEAFKLYNLYIVSVIKDCTDFIINLSDNFRFEIFVYSEEKNHFYALNENGEVIKDFYAFFNILQ